MDPAPLQQSAAEAEQAALEHAARGPGWQGRAIGARPGNQRQNYTNQFVVGAQRKDEPKETDPHRIAQRQKQVDYGKNTLGYQRYTEEIPRYLRRKINTTIAAHPETPDVRQICSKRSFDGQIKKWRRELHMWDPEEDEGLLAPVLMGQNPSGAESPDGSIETRASARPLEAVEELLPRPVVPMLEPEAEPQATANSEAATYIPLEEDMPEPSSFLSPKKQRLESGHAVSQHLVPSRNPVASGEHASQSDVSRRAPSTGSKRTYEDMGHEAFNSEDALQPATEAGTFAFDDEEQAPWLSATAGQDDAAASAGQADDIFGPAHEFD